MRKFFFLILITSLIISCNSSYLKENFNCDDEIFENLETTEDIRGLFSVKLPNNWKTNLYYDNAQTSIYSADTTKSLTNTILVDVTYIHNSLNFDDDFLLKLITKEKELQLENVKAEEIKFQDKPTYIHQSKGKKGKYNYQILNLYTKVNNDNFLHSKIEIYGDSLVNKRFCKAIDLLEKITLK